MSKPDVVLDLTNLKKVGGAFSKRNSKTTDALNVMSRIYAAEMRQRYKVFSRGGGDWPPLSEWTLRARRKAGRGVSILINTGLMFAAFSPQLLKVVTAGIGLQGKVTFGTTKTYPNGMTVADVMSFHQEGDGVPQRKLLVQPSVKTKAKMANSAKRILLG